MNYRFRQGISDLKRELKMEEEADAPVKKGAYAGELIYYDGEKELGRVRILYKNSIKKASYGDCVKKVLDSAFI